MWSHMASGIPQLWDGVPFRALLFLTVAFLFVFSWKVAVNDVYWACSRVWSLWLVVIIIGTPPDAWDVDLLVRKSCRHSTVDQHPLVWHRHLAQHCPRRWPSDAQVHSGSASTWRCGHSPHTWVPKQILVHLQIYPQDELNFYLLYSMSYTLNSMCNMKVVMYASCSVWVAMYVQLIK